MGLGIIIPMAVIALVIVVGVEQIALNQPIHFAPDTVVGITIQTVRVIVNVIVVGLAVIVQKRVSMV